MPVCRRAVRSQNLASRPRSPSPSKWLGPFQLGGNWSICSMYGIFTNICPKNHPNVGKYTIHGAYGWGNQEVKRGENYEILGKTWQDLGIRGTFETIRLGRSLKYKKLGLEKVTWGDSEQQIHQCVTMGMISEARCRWVGDLGQHHQKIVISRDRPPRPSDLCLFKRNFLLCETSLEDYFQHCDILWLFIAREISFAHFWVMHSDI